MACNSKVARELHDEKEELKIYLSNTHGFHDSKNISHNNEHKQSLRLNNIKISIVV